MRSSGTTTLFTDQADSGPQPTSFAVSLLVHGIAIAIGWFAIMYRPPVTRVVTDHMFVRKLDLHMPDMEQLTSRPRIPYPAAKAAARQPAPPSAGSPAASPTALPQTAQAKWAPQTLVQPDLPKPIQLSQEIPLPQVVIWSAPKVQVKTVTPPPPQKPTTSDVKPSVVTPNQEMSLANVNIASSFHPSAKSIVPPSTTSPLAVHAPADLQMAPVTATQNTVQASPVPILSLSDLRAKDQSVVLPPVSEIKASNTQGNGPPSPVQKPAPPSTASSGTGAGQGPPTKTNTPGPGSGQGPVAKATAPGNAAGSGSGGSANNNSGPGGGSGHAGNEAGDQPEMAGATLITVPKDGHFSSVIVGDSLQDTFPEIGDVWRGRLTYTAYLHVGLAKSWILQYSLPRATETAAAGTVARLDAPWPFSIVRPNLEPGSIDADALMVHGFVNQSGKFETLSILFPEDFPRAQFVLAALQQWQFRPAAQDGRPARVEVLLIIPEVYE